MPSLTKLVASRVSTTSAVDAVGAALGVLLAACFYLGVYLPLNHQTQWRVERMDQLRALVNGSGTAAADYARLSSRLEELKATADATRRRMGPAGSASAFVEAVTKAASAEGLRVSQIGASVPQTSPTSTTIDVTCRATGSYAGISRFLAAVSQLPQISTVEKLDLQAAVILDESPAEVVFRLYCLGELHDIERQ